MSGRRMLGVDRREHHGFAVTRAFTTLHRGRYRWLLSFDGRRSPAGALSTFDLDRQPVAGTNITYPFKQEIIRCSTRSIRGRAGWSGQYGRDCPTAAHRLQFRPRFPPQFRGASVRQRYVGGRWWLRRRCGTRRRLCLRDSASRSLSFTTSIPRYVKGRSAKHYGARAAGSPATSSRHCRCDGVINATQVGMRGFRETGADVALSVALGGRRHLYADGTVFLEAAAAGARV